MIHLGDCLKNSVLPVSVIIPVYNAESTLERCIRSINSGVLPQEIIVVDDASIDESVVLANRLARIYSNIRVILRPINGGIAITRRDGISVALCNFIAFVDADDYIEDGALEESYKTLVDTDSDICILQLWRSADDLEFEFIDLSKVRFPITGWDAAELTLESWSIHPLGVARREVYRKAYAGFSIVSMNADELITRLAFVNAGKVVSCKKKYYYVANPQSTTRTVHPRQLTVLDSDIWLLEFCRAYGFNKYRELLRAAMGDLWYLFRLRNQIGIFETRESLRRFTCDVRLLPGFTPGILREGKALLQFVLVGLYSRIPFFRKP